MLKILGATVVAALATTSIAACSSTDDQTESTSESAAAAGVVPEASAAPTGADTEQITFSTNYGDIVVRTDPRAPRTVAGQSTLADDGYFDGTICHRVVTSGIYVLQCGDPTGTGTGGPDYTLPDENLPASEPGNYPAGTVAMANAGPGTAGSQFFIVYKDTSLPPGYTIWGEVTEGLAAVAKIGRENAEAGVTDGPPTQEVTIESATNG